MRSRDYTQEVGIASDRQRAPVVVAFIVLALVAIAAIWFARSVSAYQPAQVAETEAKPAVKISQR
jgi:hypothetical protein